MSQGSAFGLRLGWASGSTSGFGLEPAERPVSRSDGSHASIKAEFYVGAYNRLHDSVRVVFVLCDLGFRSIFFANVRSDIRHFATAFAPQNPISPPRDER